VTPASGDPVWGALLKVVWMLPVARMLQVLRMKSTTTAASSGPLSSWRK
jgi:hypothetical protein